MKILLCGYNQSSKKTLKCILEKDKEYKDNDLLQIIIPQHNVGTEGGIKSLQEEIKQHPNINAIIALGDDSNFNTTGNLELIQLLLRQTKFSAPILFLINK